MIRLTLQRLSKRFGQTVALDAVDLQIEPGEIFFLLGPSGCGKTTLLRAIAGFTPPDEGRIFLGEDDVTDLPAHRRQTGMVFQSYALWPHLNVARNVAFGLEERRVPKGETARRVEEALASVRMQGLGERRIHQLSGGQQQRVALARALVIRPRCLLLDEPLSNLDAKLRLEMRSEIRRICREAGLTAVYVTHDQKEALSIADRLAVLRAGRVLQVGTPREVYGAPQSRFVADFMGEANFIDGEVRGGEGGRARVETPLGVFHAQAGAGTWRDGERVTLSIRPESWRLEAAPNDENAIEGRVVDRVYLGEMAQYSFAPAAAPGQQLKMLELNPRGEPAAEGPSRAWVAPEDVVILPRE